MDKFEITSECLYALFDLLTGSEKEPVILIGAGTGIGPLTDFIRNNKASAMSMAAMDRGVEPGLAQKVATQLMAHEALGSHARD